jgi:ligand-binding sensor protein
MDNIFSDENVFDYKFEQLFDVDELIEICESFSKLTNAAVAILDLNGDVIVDAGWQPICKNFHRINSETLKNCIKSDTILANQIQKGQKYNIYKCENGLIDVAIPITVGNNHVANLFTGQFFTEQPDVDFFKEQSKKYIFNEDEYINSLNDVQILDEEYLKKTIDFFKTLTVAIGNVGLRNLKNIENLKKIEMKSNELEMVINNMSRAFALHEMIFDENGKPINYKFIRINKAFTDITGFNNDIIGKTAKEVLGSISDEWIEIYSEIFTSNKSGAVI